MLLLLQVAASKLFSCCRCFHVSQNSCLLKIGIHIYCHVFSFLERLPPRGKTQDLKVLQAILDEAKGQPGLAGMRKMLNKMVKRIKAVQVGGLLKVGRYGSTWSSPLFEIVYSV